MSTGSTEKGPPDLDKEGFRVMVVTRFKGLGVRVQGLGDMESTHHQEDNSKQPCHAVQYTSWSRQRKSWD